LILSEEVRRRDASETLSFGSTLNLEIRGRGQERSSSWSRSKSKKSRSKSKFGRQPECWICGKTGLFWWFCQKLNKNENDSANVVAEDVLDAILLSVDSPIDSWVLEGALFHITTIREILENYVARYFGKVYLADKMVLDIVGIEDVLLRVHNDYVWKLKKVRHVPELMKNLISVGQHDDEEDAINFHDGKWKLTWEPLLWLADIRLTLFI